MKEYLRIQHTFTIPRIRELEFYHVVLHDSAGGKKELATFHSRRKAIKFAQDLADERCIEFRSRYSRRIYQSQKLKASRHNEGERG